MAICLISSEKEEIDLLKTDLDIKFVLDTFSCDSKRLCIDNLLNIIDEVDTFIIGDTKGCDDDFLASVVDILHKRKKEVKILHEFSDQLIHSNRLYNIDISAKSSNIKMHKIANPLIIVNGLGCKVLQMGLLLKLKESFLKVGITPCMISSNPYSCFLDGGSSINLYNKEFEQMCYTLKREFTKISNAGIVLILLQDDLITKNEICSINAYNILLEYLIRQNKADYVITCVPNNFDINYLSDVRLHNKNIGLDRLDCLARLNCIVDNLDYNVIKPNPILITSNTMPEYGLLNGKLATNNEDEIVKDIIDYLK